MGDHAKSYKEFIKNGIPVYTNDETAKHFEIISGERMTGVPQHFCFTVGSFSVVPFYLPHTSRNKETMEIIPCPNFGWLIWASDGNKMLYATDYEYIKYSFQSHKINHFLIECNYSEDCLERGGAKYEHVVRGHAGLNTVKEIIKVNRTSEMRNIILCHLSEGNANSEKMKLEVSKVAGEYVNVYIAEPNTIYQLEKEIF